jgi:predicted  nucleic acid-binding Zn-ribbon protein
VSAIEQLKVRLTGLKQTRHKKEEDLALHEKCVLGIKAEIDEATEEIREYESAIALLEEELQRFEHTHRDKSCAVLD